MSRNNIRLGLCCKFLKAPVKFYTTTAASVIKLKKRDASAKLSDLCLKNARSLLASLKYCSDNGIGSFRVNSQILPLKTHPQAGYQVAGLPAGEEIIKTFRQCGAFAEDRGVRTSFHPDQFILLSSPDDKITLRSVADLEYQAEVSRWIGADVINIHGGGAYGNKKQALARVAKNVRRLSKSMRSRLTLENDCRVYTPADLLPVCTRLKIPLVYDVHHHRCNPDGMTVEQATSEALKTWNREPLFHISSPKEGWRGPYPERHHDYIDIKDFPDCWRGLKITVEVEAKAKEAAVKRLQKSLLKD